MVKPTDIIKVPRLRHSRVSLEVKVTSPMFMGGATVEGELRVVIDGGKPKNCRRYKPPLSIGRISVDILGVEACAGQLNVFQNLAIELIERDRPPPNAMIVGTKALWGTFWEVIPSTTTIPFSLDLPVDMGPPPYESRNASVRYILCATLSLGSEGQRFHVRDSQDLCILTALDREYPLPFPTGPHLTATEPKRRSSTFPSR